AIGAAKAQDLKTMTLFADLLHGTMNFEMDLHREYAAKFGISSEDLEETKASATMTSYTHYMIAQAHQGGVENAVAAVLACAWSDNWIGKHLAFALGPSDHLLYGNWVTVYSCEV